MWKRKANTSRSITLYCLCLGSTCILYVHVFDICFATKNTGLCLPKRDELKEPFSEWRLSLIIPLLSAQLRQWNYQFCPLVQAIFTGSLCCKAILSLFVEQGGKKKNVRWGEEILISTLAEWKQYESVSKSIKRSNIWVSWLAASCLGAFRYCWSVVKLPEM